MVSFNRKLTRRQFVRMAGGLGAGLLAAACAPQGTPVPAQPTAAPPTQAPAAAPTSAPAVIAKPYAGKTLTIYQQASPIFEGAYNLFKPYFEDLTGAKLQFVAIPFADMQQKITLALTDPKSEMDMTWYIYEPSWLEQDLVVPLDPFINDPNLTPADWDPKDFIPAVWNSSIYNGQQYSMVCTANAMALYYRTDKLEAAGLVDANGKAKPPQTWDELKAYAQKLDKADDKPVLLMLSSTGGQAATEWLNVWYAHGYEYLWDDNGNCIINNADGVDSSKRIKDLLAYAPSGVLTWDFPEGHAAFQQGQGALFPQWNNLGGIYNDPKQSKAAGQFSIAGMPSIKVPANDGGNWNSYLSKQSKNQELAWVYLREFCSKEWQKKFFMDPVVNFNPGRESVYSDPEALASAPWMPGILASLQNAKPMQRLAPEWNKMGTILIENVGPYWAGSTDDVQAVMDKAAKEINQVLSESGRRKA